MVSLLTFWRKTKLAILSNVSQNIEIGQVLAGQVFQTLRKRRKLRLLYNFFLHLTTYPKDLLENIFAGSRGLVKKAIAYIH